MAYDYDKLFDAIMNAARSDAPVSERMLAVIKVCEAQRPNRRWEAFKHIDYDQDRDAIGGWLARALATAEAGKSYRGLWFGLSNPVYEDCPTADIYVAGSQEFASAGIDWAVASTFYPDSGALHSRVLDQVYRFAYADENGRANNAEYQLVLAYGAIVARRALEGEAFDGSFKSLAGAAAGFDDGDFIFLGRFENGRFITDIQAG